MLLLKKKKKKKKKKKVHRVILCQTCGPQRKHCFFLIAPFRSNTSIS